MVSKEELKLENRSGITLIALVITIIVLLILAGVALSSVLSQDGIFHRAEQATDKYGQAKARETFELALGEAQMKKYEEGLTDEELDEQIAKIDGELLPKEKPDPNLQNVIVDGHIFEIDRSVPKIVDYIGPADGLIITAYITGNDGWIKSDETVTVKGSIKKYGGGTVTSSSATATNGVIIPTDFPTAGGSFTIPNISVDTDITITATDSDGETVSKKIEVRIKRDGTAPTVETLNVEVDGLKIKFNVTGDDRDDFGGEGSGIKHFNYEITSTEDTTLEWIPENKRTGKFTQDQTIEIEATPVGDKDERNYTIKVTATDNCNNVTLDINAKTQNVTVIDGITLAQAKALVNESTLQQFIGKKVIDYNPPARGIWRVFYYDKEGYFGKQNALYLKRDVDKNLTVDLGSYTDIIPTNNGISYMKRMNPIWAKSKNGIENDLPNEKAISWLCDIDNWKQFTTNEVQFAVATPSIEMYIKSYNIWANGNQMHYCRIENENGYSISVDGTNYITKTPENSILLGPKEVYKALSYTWLASPSSKHASCVFGNYVGYYWCNDNALKNAYEGRKIMPIACVK